MAREKGQRLELIRGREDDVFNKSMQPKGIEAWTYRVNWLILCLLRGFEDEETHISDITIRNSLPLNEFRKLFNKRFNGMADCLDAFDSAKYFVFIKKI